MTDDYTEQFLRDLSRYHDEVSASRKKKRKPYSKPESVKRLEREHMERQRTQHPDIPYFAKKSFRDDTANGLTECVMEWLRLKGHFAARINTTGIYRKDLGRYIRSGSTKGMADISAVVNGSSISIEVKVGRDRPRPEQLKVKQQIEAAGGRYLFVRNFDDFLQQIGQTSHDTNNH